MRIRIQICVLFLLTVLSNIAAAQNTWLWAESIDRYNSWNAPFYWPYNSADKLLSYQADSLNYCTDSSLPNMLWNGIKAKKITPYQLDKKFKVGSQKLVPVKSKFLTPTAGFTSIEPLGEYLALCEVIIYRRAETSNTKDLSSLPIEWIALNFRFLNDTLMVYLKSNECMNYLKSNNCKWVHPLNHHIQLRMTDALIQRQYIIGYFNIVSPTNLQTLEIYKTVLPPLAETLQKNDPHTLTGKLEYSKDTLLIRLQAICSADIREKLNRGFNKAHLVEYLVKLHAENKIKGYAYQAAGYFTTMQPNEFLENMLVHHFEGDELIYNRAPLSALTSLHILKTYTQISNSNHISTDWLIFGLGSPFYFPFNNAYAIAFKYEDVLAALSTTNIMWYSGTNQQDSLRLDEALRKEYIDYNEMFIYSVYTNRVVSLTKYPDGYAEDITTDPACALLYEYATPIISDFNRIQKTIQEKKSNPQINTYQLSYSFTAESNSVLTKNTLLMDGLLDAIRTNKINVYRDENLTQVTNSETVLKKLDKTRFYRTGNAKKDSIYISKIPLADRFIKSSDLKEFTISSNYTTIKKKSTNQGVAFGILIPADLNPQYETDTLCYVSFNEFASFLKKNKTYKKLYPQFISLLNEHAIVTIEDFYDILLYDVTDENAAVPSELPLFVRERIIK